MIGPEKPIDAMCPFSAVVAGVTGNDRTVGKPHDQGRVIVAAIGIDQQPRKPPEYRRRTGVARKRPRQCVDADVVGDMALQFILINGCLARILV